MENRKNFLRSTLMDISDLTNHRSSKAKNQTFHFGTNYNKPKDPLETSNQFFKTSQLYASNTKNLYNDYSSSNTAYSQNTSPIKIKY